MSENSTPEERTEMPTSKRLGELRKEGALHFSQDVVQLVSLTIAFLTVQAMCPFLFDLMKRVMKRAFIMIENPEILTMQDYYRGYVELVIYVGGPIFLFTIIVAVATCLAMFLQTDWMVKEKKLKFDFPNLNPINGLKRVVSPQGLLNTGKAILKMSVVLPIGYYALKKYAPEMVMLMHTSIAQILALSGQAIMGVFWKIFYILFVFALIDYFLGRYFWLRQNKMTKDEVKDEKKSTEGDETTKRMMIQKALKKIWTRIMTAVPKAHVIITNPTHYAVALRYDRGQMNAPEVVAKGLDHLALRIREIAREHNIPIVERRTLARALYESTDVGATIPNHLFRAVAEVLAYVYRIKGPAVNPAQSSQGGGI